MATTHAEVDVWADVVGQDAAVDLLRALAERPVHAYLLVGPHGSGTMTMARAFAATLLAQVADEPARAARLVLDGKHPDVIEVIPEGAVLRGGQTADTEVSRALVEASRTPIEGSRKVIVVDHLHTANPIAVGRMLKAIEEPGDAVVWILLTESVPAHQATIASRCVHVDLHPVARGAVVERLVAEGIDAERAALAAGAAGGDLDRARLLASDEGLVERTHRWATVPERLDDTGAAVIREVDDLLGTLDELLGPLHARQAQEREALAALEEEYGPRTGERRRLTAHHKREDRLVRTDELVHGLATIAGSYRDAVATSTTPRPLVEAMARLSQGAHDLVVRNANERLLLASLLSHLPALPRR